jgi:hypothetical protein
MPLIMVSLNYISKHLTTNYQMPANTTSRPLIRNVLP